MKVRQGITLEVFGRDGISCGADLKTDRPQMSAFARGLLGRLDRELGLGSRSPSILRRSSARSRR